jgi:sugar phosphate isomerase/epimerase
MKTTNTILLTIFFLAISFFSAVSFAEDTASKRWQFFALCTDWHDTKHRTSEQQCELLKELGFDGTANTWLPGTEERAAAAKKHSIRLMQVYLRVDLSAEKPFDPNLEKVLPSLKGQGTQLALLIYGGKPSDETLDEKCVGIIRQIDELAAKRETEVVLYPHIGAWLEKVADTVRVAEKYSAKYPDKKLGVMFNLSHWVTTDKSENLEKALMLTKPLLAAVTINGTDTPEELQAKKGNRDQVLGSGSYDVLPLLKLLKKMDYRGPIGLQCYGVRGDLKETLTQSMNAWKKLNAEVAE